MEPGGAFEDVIDLHDWNRNRVRVLNGDFSVKSKAVETDPLKIDVGDGCLRFLHVGYLLRHKILCLVN